MLQYKLLRFSPRLLRWYRAHLLLDLKKLAAYLPHEGRLLDVGCGVGSLDYEIATLHPQLEILGIDINPTSISLAQTYHSKPTLRFSCSTLQSLNEKFDCILFVDVFHHVSPEEYENILKQCRRLLSPNGYVLIKDIEKDGGQIGWWMDRYISGCRELYPQNCNQLAHRISSELRVIKSEVKYRIPFPHYYIKAALPGPAL